MHFAMAFMIPDLCYILAGRGGNGETSKVGPPTCVSGPTHIPEKIKLQKNSHPLNHGE